MFLAYLRRPTSRYSFDSFALTFARSGGARAQLARSGRWFLVGLLALTSVACAKQGEGDRCDLLSGNDDCESGLMCVSLSDRNGVGAVCCPSEGDSDNPICKGNSVDLTGGDAGDDNTSTADAQASLPDAGDASALAPSDAAADADSGDVAADANATDTSSSNDGGSTSATDGSSTETLASDTTSDVTSSTSSVTESSSATDVSSSSDGTTSSSDSSSLTTDAGADAGNDAG